MPLPPRAMPCSIYEEQAIERTYAVASIVSGSQWAPTGVRSNTVDASGIPWAIVCIGLAFVEI